MNVYEKEIAEIREYENNPRINGEAVEAVAESIKQFGFKVPIIIDGRGVIVAGHTRKKAAERLGLKTAPCIIADDLTPDQVKAFRLVDNKTAELAEWDLAKLGQELADLAALDFDMGKFYFDLSEFGAEPQAIDDNFDAEKEAEGIQEPTTRVGDVWQLGRHRLICGDSTDEKTIKKLMNGARADLLLTDPPYNVAYEGGTEQRMTIKNDNMDDAEFRELLRAAFETANGAMRDGAAFYIWHSSSATSDFLSACKSAGWEVRQTIIWVKNSLVLGRQDYQWRHEPCLYGWKDGAAHFFVNDRTQTTVIEEARDIEGMKKQELKDLLREYIERERRTPSTVIHENKPMRNGDHPTMKPVPLFSRLITNSSRKGENVLDPFGGSGTSLISCEQLGRTCYISELDPVFCDVIIKRWERETGKAAVKVD